MNAIAKALGALPPDRYLLAVSGGRDSMVLLDAFMRYRPDVEAAVATFDHGTGVAAAEGVELVVRECLRRGVSVVAGRAPERASSARASEALLRDARWSFLRAVAAERRSVIATAHTLDDQAETVAMRILRDASARGLAGMAAPSPGIARPLLAIRRAIVGEYARQCGVPFVDDPSNAKPLYLRNRVRAHLLTAAESVRPGFRDELVALGARAAAWRQDMSALVDSLGVHRVGEAMVIDAGALAMLGVEGLAVVWPEVAARAGLVLDRRGVARLAEWSSRAGSGQRMPLAGGGMVERTARTFVVRRGDAGTG